MPDTMDPQQNNMDSKMEEFLKENPQIRQALEVFGLATIEYERMLASLNPTRTVTTNVTSAARHGE